jgi:outer membrane lipoprotein-sorting protein
MIHNKLPGGVIAFARHLFLLAALIPAGCGGGRFIEPVDTSMMPEMEATAAELVDGLQARADSVGGIKAGLEMSFHSPGEKEKGCSGRLVALRAEGEGGGARLYLKGYKQLVPTFFTLKSDGTGFWLHIPSEKVVYTGPFDRTEQADTAEVDLEAADLARALFVEPFESADVAGLSEESGVYILTLTRDGGLRRRLWIEKKMFAVVMEKYYDDAGGEDLEIRRSKHTMIDGAHYPLEIMMTKISTGREITLAIRELELNPEGIPPEAFRFEVPLGTRIVRLDGGSGE